MLQGCTVAHVAWVQCGTRRRMCRVIFLTTAQRKMTEEYDEVKEFPPPPPPPPPPPVALPDEYEFKLMMREGRLDVEWNDLIETFADQPPRPESGYLCVSDLPLVITQKTHACYTPPEHYTCLRCVSGIDVTALPELVPCPPHTLTSSTTVLNPLCLKMVGTAVNSYIYLELSETTPFDVKCHICSRTNNHFMIPSADVSEILMQLVAYAYFCHAPVATQL